MRDTLFESKIRLAFSEGLPVLSLADGDENVLGFSPEDLLSSKVNLRDRIHPEDAGIADALFAPASGNGPESKGFNIRIRHADGRFRCIQARSRKEKIDGTETLELVLQDARSLGAGAHEDKIPPSLRVLLENTDDFLVLKDLNHVWTGASQRLVPADGTDGHWTDLLGHTDYDLMPEEAADLHYRLEQEVLAGKPVAQQIHRSRATNGRTGKETPRWVDIRKYPVKNDLGEIVGVLSMARETEGRKPANAALGLREWPCSELQLVAGSASGGKTEDRQAALNQGDSARGCGQAQSRSERQAQVERIRQALQDGQFLMYYQPKVNMSTGKVVGAEALIRWQHPERGLLAPGEFLPLVEDHPLAVQLGEWVIETVLTQMEEWVKVGLDIPVSVNVGARQLQQPDFVDRLAALLAAHPAIDPQQLELEIQETSAPQDVAHLTKLLTGCQAIGVSFAVDEFGAGYSSLNYLKRLPANVLKIDRSFLRGILDNQEDLNILEGVLGLAAAFNRQSIASGVESVDHGLMLLRLGCELAQGYGIAHPMPAHELPGWVATWRPDPRWAQAQMGIVDDRPLMHANVEHRTWILAIEAFLKGETHVQPQLSRHQCQFGAWLDAETLAGRNAQPAFQNMVALHWRMHAMATGILKFQAQGRNDEGMVRLGELTELLDKSLQLLKDYHP